MFVSNGRGEEKGREKNQLSWFQLPDKYPFFI